MYSHSNDFCMMSFPEITGIVGAYQNCIRSVELYGPTNVAPIINRVAKSAEQAVGTASVSFCPLAVSLMEFI